MKRNELRSRIEGIRVFGGKAKPAPHKALLLLFALSRLRLGQAEVSFGEAEAAIGPILEQFGRPNNVYDPFWRLESDLWRVEDPRDGDRLRSSPYPSARSRSTYLGQLDEEVQAFLRGKPDRILETMGEVLELHIPRGLHDMVTGALGIMAPALGTNEETRSQQDSYRSGQQSFRQDVLSAYRHKCAVCSLAVAVCGRLGIGLEAAHIQMYSRGGPNDVTNGLALCATHHVLFDLGAFTIEPRSHDLVFSRDVAEFSEGTMVCPTHQSLEVVPREPDRQPAKVYLEWHRETIFENWK